MKTFKQYLKENKEELNEKTTIINDWIYNLEDGNVPYVLSELNYQLRDIIDVYKKNKFEVNKNWVKGMEKIWSDIKKLIQSM